ncbi:hypothetical protein B0H13DRAFT_1861585 [Mycena leptocephala]|nr:hypothetical protein B0H13DRAFT_1861585 [Mycena leptocephala]
MNNEFTENKHYKVRTPVGAAKHLKSALNQGNHHSHYPKGSFNYIRCVGDRGPPPPTQHVAVTPLGCHVSVVAIKFRTDSEFEPNLNPNLNSGSNEGAYAQSSLNGLTGHLKSHAEDMYQLFEILKSRGTPATSEEIDFAQRKKTLKSEPLYLTASGTRQQTLRESLARASGKNLGNWDQAEFEKLLIKWLVICDQPFCRSRLKPETIRTFKHHLHLKRKSLEDALLAAHNE